jgi:hypothetical protein
MVKSFPLVFDLKDGTHVMVNLSAPGVYEFHLTRLNSEKHNFFWKEMEDAIEESYETRFDNLQREAVAIFKKMADDR